MLTIHVTGTPAPQGSKRGFYNKNLGRVQMVESSAKVKPWRQDVTAAVLNTIAEHGWDTPSGAVEVGICFYLARPRYHFRTGKRAHELKPNAPTHVDKKPDIDKLARATLDALTASGAIRDDAQVARLVTEKKYAGTVTHPAAARLFPGPAATGATITITPLDVTTAAQANDEQGALL